MADLLDASATPAGKALSPRLRRRLRVLAFIVVPALFMGVLAVGLIRTQSPKVKQGAPAPQFSLPTVGGGTLASSDLKGTPVVINFWASWCDSCNLEAPDLEAMWKQYQARGVRVVGVDYEDQAADAQAFVAKYGITYPSVVDKGGQLATTFGVRGVPETYFIDAQGRFFSVGQGQEQGTRLGTKIQGPVSRTELKGQLDAMLAAASSPASASPRAGTS
jgi:cytochrome c biogenesis protein CcmG/thiol:disulfide interchange protein DsbE